MQKTSLKFAALLLAVSLGGCGLLPDKIDETAGWSASKLYSEARAEMDAGGYEKAVSYFEKLESRYPFGTYAQQAQMEIAYAYYRQGDQAQALAAVDRFIKLHPNHPNVDYMYYLRGLINFNDRPSLFSWITEEDPSDRDSKAARDAFDAFKQLAERFPNSPYTKDAILRMKYLVNSMAKYEVHVAQYYYRRGAYLAAANRAQRVVTDYRETPSIEDALVVLVRSYEALGMKQLRDDAERVLKTNFPDSAYYTGSTKSKKDSPWWKIW